MNHVKQTIIEIDRVIDKFRLIDLSNMPTAEVYSSYVVECEDLKIKPINKIAFSRLMITSLGYSLIDKKIDGVKYRLFSK